MSLGTSLPNAELPQQILPAYRGERSGLTSGLDWGDGLVNGQSFIRSQSNGY